MKSTSICKSSPVGRKNRLPRGGFQSEAENALEIADHPISQIQDLLPWNLAPSLLAHSVRPHKTHSSSAHLKNKWTPHGTLQCCQ